MRAAKLIVLFVLLTFVSFARPNGHTFGYEILKNPVGKLVLGEDKLKPCAAAGIQELLLRSGNDPKGTHVAVVGRSNIVGKPGGNILLQKQVGANAAVSVAHTGASDVRCYTKIVGNVPFAMLMKIDSKLLN